jgi:hypothetical protein
MKRFGYGSRPDWSLYKCIWYILHSAGGNCRLGHQNPVLTMGFAGLRYSHAQVTRSLVLDLYYRGLSGALCDISKAGADRFKTFRAAPSKESHSKAESKSITSRSAARSDFQMPTGEDVAATIT